MNNKLLDSVDLYLNCYRQYCIANKIPLDPKKEISQFHEIDVRHHYVSSELQTVRKKIKSSTEKPTSSDLKKHMKSMFRESLDLDYKKSIIANRLTDIVNDDDAFELKKNVKNIDQNEIYQNEPDKKLNESLQQGQYYYTSDSASTENLSVSSVTSSDKHLNSNKKFSGAIFSESDQDITEHENSDSKSSSSSCSSSKDSVESLEPTYCICEEISYGKMVCCDNDLCPIEWFHFGCVNLTVKPKGKWYCPKCRGTNSKKMKPRNIILKELEEYNKAKEEYFNIN